MAIYDLTKTPADSYDTHTHLNDDKLFHDVPAYIGRANEFRVMEMNIVGYDAVGNARALEIALYCTKISIIVYSPNII